MSEYKPKPFTKELAEQMKVAMTEPFDEKRTLCNVLKLAYRCSREESYNLQAVQALLLESLWMGQRMHAKLYEDQQAELKHQAVTQDEDEDPFAVDWSNLDGRNVAQGNWD
jgi:hypothetical protein